MKMRVKYCAVLVTWAACMMGNLFAQQIPISLNSLAHPRIYNTAAAGSWDAHQLVAVHQQRGDLGNGWGRVTDFFSVSSARASGGNRWGWGLQIYGDHDHTDLRIGMSPTLSVAIVQQPGLRVGLGISGGFLFYGPNYDNIPIFHAGDPQLVRNSVMELDAGTGLDIALRRRWVRADLGLFTSQLPGNAISTKVATMQYLPHVVMYGGAGFKLAYNLYVGPRAYYKNTFLAEGLTLKRGQTDIGLRADFDRQKLWVMGGYRLQKSGLVAGLGLQIWERDSLQHPEQVYMGLDMSAMFNMPGWGNNNLGPTAELTVALRVGQRYKAARVDTLRDVGPIWESGANLTRHKDERLAPSSPPGLNSVLTPLDSHVVITYELPDDSRNFVGENPVFFQDTLLQEIGAEWSGIDNFLENVMAETVEECLSPNLENVLNLDRMDSLKRLMWVELRTDLRWDRQSAMTGPGIAYNGELNPPGHKYDSLIFKVVYDERDTTVAIPSHGHFLNNFELAALKLYAMRKKIEYELEKYYAARNRNVLIAWEDEPLPIQWDINADEIELKPTTMVFIRKLRIESDHPKQKSMQLNMVTLKFRRYKGDENRARVYAPRGNDVFSSHEPATGRNGKPKRGRTSLLDKPDFGPTKAGPQPKQRPQRQPRTTQPQNQGLNH